MLFHILFNQMEKTGQLIKRAAQFPRLHIALPPRAHLNLPMQSSPPDRRRLVSRPLHQLRSDLQSVLNRPSCWRFRTIFGAIKVIQPVSLQTGFTNVAGQQPFCSSRQHRLISPTVFPAKAEKNKQHEFISFLLLPVVHFFPFQVGHHAYSE